MYNKNMFVYGIVWLFILSVTYLDIYILCLYSESVQEWEINPLTIYIYNKWGIGGCVVLRTITIAFSMFVWEIALLTRKKLADVMLLVVFTIHVALLTYYYYIWSNP